MPILALVIAAVALDRVLVRTDAQVLRGVRERWLQTRPLVARYVRSAPATFTYLGVLAITTWVLWTSSPAVAERLLLERSTNLHQLARDPVRVLVASAFWLPGTWQLLLWLPLFVVLVAPIERTIGSLRATAVFAAGHVGATLLTALGLWLALRLDVVEQSITRAVDVGSSYGFLALLAVAAWLLERRVRIVWIVALLGCTGILAAISPTFTAFGHVLSILAGLACYPLVRGRRIAFRRHRQEKPRSPRTIGGALT